MYRKVPSSEYAALPAELYRLIDDMGCFSNQWSKGRDFGKEVGIPICHQVLAYLDTHEDIEWVRCLTYWMLMGFYDNNPMAVVIQEIEEEEARIEAMSPVRRWWHWFRFVI